MKDLLREWGLIQIMLGWHPTEWRQSTRGGVLQRAVLVGCTLHNAHMAAATTLAGHDDVLGVTALVHDGGQRSQAAAGLVEGDSLGHPLVGHQAQRPGPGGPSGAP